LDASQELRGERARRRATRAKRPSGPPPQFSLPPAAVGTWRMGAKQSGGGSGMENGHSGRAPLLRASFSRVRMRRVVGLHPSFPKKCECIGSPFAVAMVAVCRASPGSTCARNSKSQFLTDVLRCTHETHPLEGIYEHTPPHTLVRRRRPRHR